MIKNIHVSDTSEGAIKSRKELKIEELHRKEKKRLETEENMQMQRIDWWVNWLIFLNYRSRESYSHMFVYIMENFLHYGFSLHIYIEMMIHCF